LPALAATIAFYALVFRDRGLTLATSAGVTLSYLLNEWVHFTAHRPELRGESRLLDWVTRGHLRHHEEDPRKHFGLFIIWGERVLAFLGLMPSYVCGQPQRDASLQFADDLRDRIGCGEISTEHDDSSDSVVVAFPDACAVAQRHFTGEARVRYSAGDDREDV